MRMNRLVAAIATIAVSSAMGAAHAAVCGEGSANLSAADQSLHSVTGCNLDFVDYTDSVYHIHLNDWTSRGWGDWCNINLEYAKHWTSAWLIEHGLADNYSFAFHGTTDYRQLSVGNESVFHSEFYHNIGNDLDKYGQYYDLGSIDRSVTTYCRLYDVTLDFRGNPASRASDYVHEAWHGWQKHYGYGGHYNGPSGACTLSGSSCDYWYPHGIGAFDFGQLYTANYNATPKLFHSANQVQVEFLCDLAEFPAATIPANVLTSARADANDRALNRFVNGPGFRCGDPRPW